MSRPLRFAAIGLDHRHIYDHVTQLLAAGATCAGYCPETSDPRVLEGFRERFPQLAAVSRDQLLDDPGVDFICCAAVPRDRAALAIRAMRAGKDVMMDKPGAITLEECDAIDACARETGRIFSICFSERFLVSACEVATQLVAEGAIGRVIQTTGLGPHRLNRAIRPEWFFDPAAYGGILTDIASHQIDQFLFFTGSTDAGIVASTAANRGMPDLPEFQDFGEILIRGSGASGYIRVDWFTPDGLPVWGDGRLFLLGTEGYIELRKYVDIAGRPGGDHVFLSNAEGTRRVDSAGAELVYFRRFLEDVRARSRTAMPEGHALRVTRLAIAAQASAARA